MSHKEPMTFKNPYEEKTYEIYKASRDMIEVYENGHMTKSVSLSDVCRFILTQTRKLVKGYRVKE